MNIEKNTKTIGGSNMEIFENESFQASNLISYRGTHSPQEMHVMMSKMGNYVEQHGAKQTGMMITALYSSDKETRISDTQILVSLDKVIPSSAEFVFLSELTLTECLAIKHKGDPRVTVSAFAALEERASSMNCQLVKPIYNVIRADAVPSSNGVEIEMYVKTETK